jgi:ATP-binding cassette subfamily F protein 3
MNFCHHQLIYTEQTMSFLTIENVSKTYFEHLVLDRISMRVDKSERLALIGSNGAGKTTLLKIITGQEKPDSGRIILPAGIVPGYLSQHVEEISRLDKSALHDQELSDLETRLRRSEIELAELTAEIHELQTNQNEAKNVADLISSQKRLMSQYSNLTSKFEAAGGYDFRHRMQEAMDGLGLGRDILGRPLSTLSGGERMRVALARLLLRSPDLLLLDEPTNHLDADAMEWLEQYLNKFKGAVILISHDRTFIDRTATSVAELSNGLLTIHPGNYTRFQEIENLKQDTLGRELVNVEKELSRQQKVTQTMLSHRNMSGYHAREKVSARLSAELAQIKSGVRHPVQKLNFRFLPGRLGGAPDKELIRVTDVSIRFGSSPLFSDVSFTINRGRKVCICGPNGCGKSTLLNLLLGRIEGFSGTIGLSRQAVFAYMGQHIDFPDEAATILDTVAGTYETDEAQARNLLARFGFRDVEVFKTIKVLSGGERARVYLCMLLLEQPDVLFLDEPTNHLDIYSREILENALQEFDGAILSVSHDRYFITKCSDYVLGFLDGGIKDFGTYDEYRKHAAAFSKSVSATVNTAGDDSSTAISDGKKALNTLPENNNSGQREKRKNRAEERRSNARQKQNIQQLEKSIQSLESRKIEIEAQFSLTDDSSLYEEYAQLINSIEELYENLIELSE